jgi:hypothetical protein
VKVQKSTFRFGPERQDSSARIKAAKSKIGGKLLKKGGLVQYVDTVKMRAGLGMQKGDRVAA